ncbi:peptidoglycan editing factor PgeF [Lacisediminimonas sp.]|uniref:peptidoglycan editing factor PgeF n=1 Tax=Lacisediminimonas sp. TaxID=3060582 RepID=UPI00271BE47C|nr:peptidoglycan editing factor PgeF [Lacisediminimonas sp.]MDO8299687.1 peptidoglycan editing factor PgeF [Lacisediminimonas sp.]
MSVLRPAWLPKAPPVGALSSLRSGGVSRGAWGDGSGNGRGGLNLGLHVGDQEDNVLENRRRLGVLLPSQPAWLTQVHGATVVDAGAAVALAGPPQADASISTRPGVVCAILTADCLPVLFADVQGKVVGAAHAGWRGLAAGVLENTVQAMRTAGAGEIVAWLGPAIGPANFEVGEDVRAAFAGQDAACATAFVARPGLPGKYLADIYALARRRLLLLGISGIAGGERCTVAEAASFYSYRRDGVTGRMASLIWIN